MSSTWYGSSPPDPMNFGLKGKVRLLVRGLPLIVLLLGGLLLKMLVRLVEQPLYHPKRPITPAITVFVCRNALRLLGLRLKVVGQPMKELGAVVANHSSWLDIFALNARKRIYFVSKAEVARWPGIGVLARATGTVFIERDRKKSREQANLFRERLEAGHRLLFFPEGTSSDGQQVLSFKSTLFSAFFNEDLRPHLAIQPVSVRYRPPSQLDPRFLAWWGDMSFAPHLVQVLSAPSGGTIDLHYAAPLAVRDFTDRKTLARACEGTVRASFETRAPE